MSVTLNRKVRRRERVSANMEGTVERPRVSVYRSNKYVFAQAIDDVNGKTVAGVNSKTFEKEKTSKSDASKQAGVKLAEVLKEMKIKAVIFDRSGYAYNGRVKALAEGLRDGGIQV